MHDDHFAARLGRGGRLVALLVVAPFLLNACMGGVPAAAPPIPPPTALPPTPNTGPNLAVATPTVGVAAAGATPLPAGHSIARDSAVVYGQVGVPAFSHVFLIVLENASFRDVDHSAAMPYLNQLGDQYTVATDYHAITHPSLPNYLALLGGSTFGVTSDCVTCNVDAPNLTDQLDKAGKSWAAYMEGMPGACSALPDWPPGRYAKKHDPFLYFDGLRTNPARCEHVVPYSDLASALSGGNVPDFVWISPDMCHDGHDCPLDQTDAWLRAALPPILNSSAFKDNGALFVTFDEGNDNGAGGGQVYTLVASPLAKRGARVSVPYNHYSLLRTVEDAWDLPHLAHAGDPGVTNMAACFGR